MANPTTDDVTLRPITPADAEACGRIVYEAFRCIAERHGFTPDIPSPEMGTGLATAFAGTAGVYGVVAEQGGRVVGSNFLDQRDAIHAVGPITVDPAAQAKGVGRRLMQAVVERGRSSNAAGIRLVQDAFNTASMSLYASLGFEAKEPLALIRGTPKGTLSTGAEVRPMTEADLPACAALCRSVHGVERTNELRGSMPMFHPVVLVRGGRVAAYASSPTFWIMNHGVAQTEQDMQDLLVGAGNLTSGEPLSLLLPIRQASLFRWCLGAGMRVVKPMTLMAIGQYQEPRGTWFPSVQY